MAKKYYGVDNRRKCVFGRFYRDKLQPLKRDLITLEELEFKQTSRGKVARSKAEQDRILSTLYHEKLNEFKTETSKQTDSAKVLDILRSWLQSVERTRHHRTFIHYRSSVSWFFKANPKALKASDLQGANFDAMAKLIAAKINETSANSHLRSIKAGFRWACSQGLIDKVPPVTMLRVAKKPPEVFSHAQLHKMHSVLLERSSLHRRWECLLRAFMVLRWTGIRGSELTFLQWRDFDFQSEIFWIKDRESNRIKGRREEDVPIATPLLRFLLERDRTNETWVLDNGKGKRFWDEYTGLSRAMRRFQNELEINGPKALHGFRATLATQLAGKPNANLSHVQQLLRHVHITTTMEYVRQEKSGIKRMLDDLDND